MQCNYVYVNLSCKKCPSSTGLLTVLECSLSYVLGEALDVSYYRSYNVPALYSMVGNMTEMIQAYKVCQTPLHNVIKMF